MQDFLKLIRYKNLLIVAFTQIVVYLTVHNNFLNVHERQLGGFDFFLLMLSTVLITGAGYIINDYFDVKIDSINKPKSMIITNSISSKRALLYHNLLNVIAVIISGYVAWEVGEPYLVIIQIISITLLWFYSTHFKRMSIIGNVVVSLMTAMSVLILLLFEPNLYTFMSAYEVMLGDKINPALHIFVVSIFAFLLNWMREIIKDIEDFKGDHEQGCRTYPIVHGLKKSVHFVHGLNIITMLMIILSMLTLFNIKEYISASVLFIPLIGLMYFSYKLPQLSSFRQFGKLSALLKWIMVIGLLDLLIIVYL